MVADTSNVCWGEEREYIFRIFWQLPKLNRLARASHELGADLCPVFLISWYDFGVRQAEYPLFEIEF
jgi:hypothetical protein